MATHLKEKNELSAAKAFRRFPNLTKVWGKFFVSHRSYGAQNA
jgi:hypothetical protein